jgi:hypothetical protein
VPTRGEFFRDLKKLATEGVVVEFRGDHDWIVTAFGQDNDPR